MLALRLLMRLNYEFEMLLQNFVLIWVIGKEIAASEHVAEVNGF